MIFFTSDKHLDHLNIIKYCERRRFAKDFLNPTREEALAMTEELISIHNSRVSPLDEVWDVGDLAFGPDASLERTLIHLRRLNGKKHFVEGNHDQFLRRALKKDPSLGEFHTGYPEIEVQDQRIVLCHYKLTTWHHDLRGVWHLYGHSHGGLNVPTEKSMDVGVDTRPDYAPYSFEEIKVIMDARPLGKHPEFRNFTVGENYAPKG